MPSLYAYRKVIDTVTTHTLRLPEATQGGQAGHELATLADGRTVVVLFDAYSLPTEQPSPIAASVELLPTALPDLLREQIKAASTHVQLIGQRMIDRIRATYTIDDEMYFARIGVGTSLGMYVPSPSEQVEMAAFGDFCEATRQWGRDERAKLGL